MNILIKEINMATRKRINITIHPIELKKLDRIAELHSETRSGMIERLIQGFKEYRDKKDIGDLTELSYELRDRSKDKDKVK